MARRAVDARRRSPDPLNLRSVREILRRSSSLFFTSSSVFSPLLVASLLFLFRFVIQHLTLVFTSFSLLDPSIPTIKIFSIIFVGLASIAFIFILYPALHLTVLLAVLPTLLNESPPNIIMASFIAAFRHGTRSGDDDLLHAFRKTWWVGRQIQIVLAIVLVLALMPDVGAAARVVPITKMGIVTLVAPLYTMDRMAPPLIIASGMFDLTLSVLYVNLTPWVLLFLDADDKVRMGVMFAVKRGCELMALMPRQAVGITMVKMAVCGQIGRRCFVVVGGGSALFAAIVQSVAEVYFIVVWLVFYIAARCKAEELKGRKKRKFGPFELEHCLTNLRS